MYVCLSVCLSACVSIDNGMLTQNDQTPPPNAQTPPKNYQTPPQNAKTPPQNAQMPPQNASVVSVELSGFQLFKYFGYKKRKS